MKEKRPTPRAVKYSPQRQQRVGFSKMSYEEGLSKQVSQACDEYFRRKGIVIPPWNGGPARGSTEGDEDEP